MRVALICVGLVLAGGAWAQVRAVSGTTAPVDNWPVLVIASGSPAAAESSVVRVIQVNHLDIRLLCEALGGTYIDLRPLYAGYGRQGQDAVRGAAGSGLDRNAPLADFVPATIADIVGVQY